MLIDDVTIHVKAGRGGDGVALFAKALMTLGPTGGDGGRGGNVYARGVSDLGALRTFRSTKNVTAGHGKHGGQDMAGGKGRDAIVSVPVGTIVRNLETGEKHEITKVGEKICIAHGGRGGLGNFRFRSSRDTSPKKHTDGRAGQEGDVRMELKMIADIGFVGLPNIGKSSLLNELTNASSHVANYQFTTLSPHLGVYYELILADIPGLITGAAEGKGLGHKFLRHIERTKILFHFIAADSAHPLEDYNAIRAELGSYNPKLLTKPEYIIVSRADERTPEEVAQIVTELKKANPNVVTLSILDETLLNNVRTLLNTLKDMKNAN